MTTPPTSSVQRPSSIAVIKQRVEGEALRPPEQDLLAIEDPLEILLSTTTDGQTTERTLSVTMRTPGQDEELLTGFLFSEGLIDSAADITGIELNQPGDNKPPTRARVHLHAGLAPPAAAHERRLAMQASCGVCGSASLEQLALSPELKLNDTATFPRTLIHDLPARMNEAQPTFQQTGGLHAAALFSPTGELLATHEDIGRHNALDKVIGARLQAAALPATGQMLCVSGRMSYDILQKALRAQIPLVAGVGAPSSLAVLLANEFNVTLLGFVRNRAYNIYSAPERLIP